MEVEDPDMLIRGFLVVLGLYSRVLSASLTAIGSITLHSNPNADWKPEGNFVKGGIGNSHHCLLER